MHAFALISLLVVLILLIGADSLAVVELVLALEEAFEIDIPDEDTEKLRTLADAVNYITAKSAG